MLTFTLTENEEERAIEFKKNHTKKCGGTFKYIFHIVSMGITTTIKCNVCKIKTNITDYGAW